MTDHETPAEELGRLRRELSEHHYDTPEHRAILDRISVLVGAAAVERLQTRRRERAATTGDPLVTLRAITARNVAAGGAIYEEREEADPMAGWADGKESDELEERRLIREARENFLGSLVGDPGWTDVARVEVSWYYNDPGYGPPTRTTSHAGYYLAYVRPAELADDATENERLEQHPATLAEELARAELDRRQERQGFAEYAIDEVTSA